MVRKLLPVQDPARFKELQKITGLKAQALADLFRVSIETIYRWREQETFIPHAVMMCMESLVNDRPIEGSALYPDKLVRALETVTFAIHKDPDYAQKWHNHIVQCAIDSGIHYTLANEAAIRFMYLIFEKDTATGIPPFKGAAKPEYD